jgi:DivIVA domain-containing protein
MTLSLDDVRNKRFRMARKSGYEVLEVDEFVDEVEVAFAQLVEENQNLKNQVDSLRQAPADAGAAALGVTDSGQPTKPPAPIVVTTGKEASSAVVRLVEISTEQSERLVAEATEDANRIREEASRSAQQVTGDARTKAERMESEARINSERVQSGAIARAEKVNSELEQRRAQMVAELEQQRDRLGATVMDLRKFEAAYRSNLTTHLRTQIETLESGRAEPENAPDLGEGRSTGAPTGSNGDAGAEPAAVGASENSAPPGAEDNADDQRGLEHHKKSEHQDGSNDQHGRGGAKSNTPRLDALLGDQR